MSTGHTLEIAPGISIRYLPVPAELRREVLLLFHFCCEHPALDDMFPAMTGFVSFRLRGESWLGPQGDAGDAVEPLCVLAPTTQATPILAKGPFHAIGAVLTPLGWAALTRLHASEHAGAILDASALQGTGWDSLALDMQRDYAHGTGPAELAQRLARQISASLVPVDPRHETMIRAVDKWLAASLDPPLDDLYRQSSYSTRQVQRLVERYYGCSPKVLVRKFRALRIFAMLQSGAASDQDIAAVVDLYYDQSHLIREFRQFIGRTPRELQAIRLPVLSTMLAQRNFRAIWPAGSAPNGG